MNWYQQNRWIGNFLFAFALSSVFAIWFLFHSKGEFVKAFSQFNQAATEHMRLEHLSAFPNEENLRKAQTALKRYLSTLNQAKDDLKTQVVPLVTLAPNQFQTQLRQAIANTNERARINQVKLPENFHLGFDEFTAALPDTVTSPVLGQHLGQVELLLNILIDNHVDAITDLKRIAVPLESPSAPATTPRKFPTGPPNVIERWVVDFAFTASPMALRRVLNQIASFERQFFIVRTLHVRNEQPNGPLREQSSEIGVNTTTGNMPTSPAIKFIVGEEHLEVAASVEILSFKF